MARTTTRLGPRRNSAPAWKKISVVLSAPVAMILAIELLHINTWNAIPSSSCSSRSLWRPSGARPRLSACA